MLWTPGTQIGARRQAASRFIQIWPFRCAMIHQQPLRQTEGFMRGLVRIMGLDVAVQGFSTLSRRDSGLGLSGGEIVWADLTQGDFGDPTALPRLLDQFDAPVTPHPSPVFWRMEFEAVV